MNIVHYIFVVHFVNSRNMGVTDRKEREKEEMKSKILDAARRLFLENGFEKTSIRSIAEAIEYSPGTIYLYYKDKNDLLFALHQESFSGLMQSFTVLMSIPDPFERLVVMGKNYLEFAYNNPELYELMFLLSAPIEALMCCQDIWEDGWKSFDMLKLILTDCQAHGYFKDKNIDDLALTVWAAVHGMASLHLRKRTMMFAEEERMPRLNSAFEMLITMLKNL